MEKINKNKIKEKNKHKTFNTKRFIQKTIILIDMDVIYILWNLKKKSIKIKEKIKKKFNIHYNDFVLALFYHKFDI